MFLIVLLLISSTCFAARGVVIYLDGELYINGKKARLFQFFKDCELFMKKGVAVVQLSDGRRVVLEDGARLVLGREKSRRTLEVRRRKGTKGLKAVWEAIKKGWYVERLRASRRIPVCISTVSP